MPDDIPIKTDAVYEYDDYGNVLVVSIIKTYDEWSPDGGTRGETNAHVLFYDRYDEYGGMQPSPFSETVDEFYESSEYVEDFEYPSIHE